MFPYIFPAFTSLEEEGYGLPKIFDVFSLTFTFDEPLNTRKRCVSVRPSTRDLLNYLSQV